MHMHNLSVTQPAFPFVTPIYLYLVPSCHRPQVPVLTQSLAKIIPFTHTHTRASARTSAHTQSSPSRPKLDPGVRRGWVVAGLVVQFAVRPRG